MLASAFGGLIAAGIVARMEGKMGRPAWVSWQYSNPFDRTSNPSLVLFRNGFSSLKGR